jgi:hypothetical protein
MIVFYTFALYWNWRNIIMVYFCMDSDDSYDKTS